LVGAEGRGRDGRRTPSAGRYGPTAKSRVVTFEDGQGRLRVHSVLPLERDVVTRGGAGLGVLDAG
jgi:hypothetical protein